MSIFRIQDRLDGVGAAITDPDGDQRLVPGPLQLRDRTVWWTGRVAIGLLHVRRPAHAMARLGPQVLCTTPRQRLAMRLKALAWRCVECVRSVA